jgi:hypothetical protein
MVSHKTCWSASCGRSQKRQSEEVKSSALAYPVGGPGESSPWKKIGVLSRIEGGFNEYILMFFFLIIDPAKKLDLRKWD